MQDVHDRPLVAAARLLRDMRAKCAGLFPRNLFRDSAWDMMLELFLVGEAGGTICVKQLMLAANETSTGAARRIDGLEEADFVRRRCDPADHRRVTVSLTEKGRSAMVAMLQHISDANVDKQTEPVQPVSFKPQGFN